MAYRILDGGKLGPYISGEPPESLILERPSRITDVQGHPWTPADLRSSVELEVDALVEQKLANGGSLPGAPRLANPDRTPYANATREAQS